jgi:hypothetical protein
MSSTAMIARSGGARRRKLLTPLGRDPREVMMTVGRTLSADGVRSMVALISRAGARRAVVDPVDHQLSLLEVPMTVHLHELIQEPD